MAVTKRKDMDWKEYLNELIANKSKLSDVEKAEFCGLLLKRDLIIDQQEEGINDEFFALTKLTSNLLIAESPETISDLINHLKKVLFDYYDNEINELLNINKQKDEKQ